MMAGTPQQTTW